MSLPFAHLTVFVATRRQDVPTVCQHYLSVDGTVPGAALAWDHHVTGERINLEAMPEQFDPSGYDGVGTTLADADALASVLAVLAGGKSQLPAEARAILESASFWCDHLVGHPERDPEINRLGRGLLDAISERLEGSRGCQATPVFSALAGELGTTVSLGRPLPWVDRFSQELRAARRLVADGRLMRRGQIALIDLRGAGPVDPAALYAQHECPVAVEIEPHRDGGPRYTVGAHPALAAPADLRPALRALAKAEYAHGPPALSPEAAPGAENWGGRARVFGSPWNYPSRLGPDEVMRIVSEALGLRLTGQ